MYQKDVFDAQTVYSFTNRYPGVCRVTGLDHQIRWSTHRKPWVSMTQAPVHWLCLLTTACWKSLKNLLLRETFLIIQLVITICPFSKHSALRSCPVVLQVVYIFGKLFHRSFKAAH